MIQATEPHPMQCADCAKPATQHYNGPHRPRPLCDHHAAAWRLVADHRHDRYVRLSVEVEAA